METLPEFKNENKYIVVVVDLFTKYVELKALKSLKAEEAANKLLETMYRHGVPQKILSDQGTNFQADLLNTIWELLDVHKMRTKPYHPEGDGETERFNRTLHPMLLAHANEDKDNWDDQLQQLAFAYNTSIHATTGYTP